MASIEIRKNMIYLSAMIFDENLGKNARKRQTTGLKHTKENLKIVQTKYLPKFEQQLAAGEMKVSIKVPTVKAIGEEYIKTKNQSSNRNYSTVGYENSLIRDVYPQFGNRAVDSITTAEINKWQAEILLKVKEKRAQNIKLPFNGLMTLALKNRVVKENPFVHADKIKVKKSKEAKTILALDLKESARNGATAEELIRKIKGNKVTKKDPFSEQELKVLFSEAKGMLKNYIQIAFFTAMRPSEMIALTWGQVNLEKKFVLCAGAITGKETLDERELNKSENSVRVIYLCDQVVEAFKEQYKLTGHKSEYIFLTQYNKPFASAQSISDKLFKKLIEDTKVRSRRLYALRER
jgi:integrase